MQSLLVGLGGVSAGEVYCVQLITSPSGVQHLSGGSKQAGGYSWGLEPAWQLHSVLGVEGLSWELLPLQ